ncbi:MAG: M28 family peptidase [Gaiellaceae bacterium]
MAAAPPRPERRRPRPGSLERPINGRLYRGTWLLVALPLLLAAFSVARPAALPPPNLPPAFDRDAALVLAQDLSARYPSRVPGSAGALGAAHWFSDQLVAYGFQTETEAFSAHLPGIGTVRLENLIAVARGRSDRSIVVMAHRDDTGIGPGANDNASGTAALVELARAYANPRAAAGDEGASSARVQPTYTLVFLSTDGGAYGNLGAAEFAARSPHRNGVVAVLNLDSIASRGAPRLEFAGDTARSPAASLVETAAAQILQETGRSPGRPSALRQLIDLGFPFSLYGQAPFVARGIPAVTLTTAPDRPPESFADTPRQLSVQRLGQLGRSAQTALDSLDQGLDLAQGTSSYVFLGPRIVRGWAIELVLIAALLPFFATVVDLFARCRRRRVAIAPALRSYRSRLGFWLWGGGVFLVFALAGVWPRGAPRPPAFDSAAAQRWPAAGAISLLGLMALGWLVARDRLLPRRQIRGDEILAGHVGALLSVGVVALLVVATNPFALIFVLPSLHAWLWLPQVRHGPLWLRGAVLFAGFLGPALLLYSFGARYGLGLDAPWYIAELFALGYAPFPALLIGLGWLAGAGQFAALVGGRYAPYPPVGERPPRGLLRELVRRTVVARGARRHSAEEARRVVGR